MNNSDENEIPDFGVREQDSWIIQSPAQRILREGDPPPEFSAKLAHFHHSDQVRSKLLHSVCARLTFIEQLKYTLQVKVADFGPLKYQHENLINYLTLTCLDIVAGKNPTYRRFPNWLSDQLSLESEDWPEELRRYIRTINSISRRGFIDRLRFWRPREAELTHDEILVQELCNLIEYLYQDEYLDEYGLHRNMQRLIIHELPLWLREWLAETFYISRGGITSQILSEGDRDYWQSNSMTEKLKLIAKHLYKSRNRFTHSTLLLPPLERPGMISISIGDNEYRFENIYHDDDLDSGINYSVGIRDGLAQSDVVRLIVVTQLRTWASIENSEELIPIYLRRSTYRQAAYSFLNELTFNRDLILAWAHSLIFDLQSRYSTVVEYELSSTYASKFHELDSSKPSYRGIRFEGIDDYINLISEVNLGMNNIASEYKELINSNSFRANQMIVKLINELIFSDQVRKLIRLIDDFTQTIDQTLGDPFY